MAGFGYQILGFGSGGAAAPYNVQYLVVAGGGSGGTFSYGGAGGGAGGFRNVASKNFEVVQGRDYTVTVGGGGAGNTTSDGEGIKGQNSVFDTITSAGGGGGINLGNTANQQTLLILLAMDQEDQEQDLQLIFNQL